MEARFIVRHTPSREDMTILVRNLNLRSRILLFILALVYWVLFGLEVYWYYWDGYHTFLLIFAIALTLFAAFFPRIAGWNIWRSWNKKIKEVQMAFCDDCVRASTNLEESTKKYDVFVRIVESDDYFYLYAQKRLAHILPKAGFIQGEPADFAAFISEKTALPVKQIKRRH